MRLPTKAALILTRGLAPAALVAAILCAAPGTTVAAVPAPRLPPGQSRPVTAPYDTTADAHNAVKLAAAAARAQHKTLLIDFGGNWCPDCRILAGAMQQPALATWVDQHFLVVKVDVGRFTKNMDIAQHYGVKVTGVPAVLAIAPDGTVLNRDDAIALANARTMSDQALADKLASWAP